MLTAEQRAKYRELRAQGHRVREARDVATYVAPQDEELFNRWSCYPGTEILTSRGPFTVSITVERDDWQDVSFIGKIVERSSPVQNVTRWREKYIPREMQVPDYSRPRFMLAQQFDPNNDRNYERRTVWVERDLNRWDDSGRMVEPEMDMRDTWQSLYQSKQYTKHEAYTLARKYFLEECKRMDAWANDEWTMLTILVSVSYEGEVLGRAACGGIESDADYTDFNEIANDMLTEALDEAKHTAPQRAAHYRERAAALAAIA